MIFKMGPFKMAIKFSMVPGDFTDVVKVFLNVIH